MEITLATILTIGGAVAAAGLITGLIAIAKNLKRIGPLLDRGNEPTAAFVLSAILVALAFLAKGTQTADGAFEAFIAWYAIAKIAMGIHDDVAGLESGKPPA